MKTNLKCEICGAANWSKIGSRVYRESDNSIHSEYEKKRLDVLFGTWLPGETEVEITSLACEDCGFVCYSPRPDSADIDAKYLALEQMGQDYGKGESSAVAQRRADRLFKECHPFLPSGKDCDVLDYGGGDGRLMSRMAEAGHNCCLVDYNKTPMSHVQKIGDTINDIDPGRKFDLIVANHVIEHVAEPLAVIDGLAKHLNGNGAIYIEVPMEIWAGAPLHSEPVTHINFFTCQSLSKALVNAGSTPCLVKNVASLHPGGQYLPAVRAIGHLNLAAGLEPASKEYTSFASHLNPSVPMRLARRLLMWREIPQALAWRVGLSR